jgi:tetratricopeptide (TPR) repeat protein
MSAALNHLDDCTLLRHVARDLSDFEERSARRHLLSCGVCRRNLEKIEELDLLLREAGPELFGEAEREGLPSGDPFRLRPVPRPLKRAAGPGGLARATECLAAAKEASRRKNSLLSCRDAGEKVLRNAFAGLRLSEPTDRYTLGYALEEAVSRMVEAPTHWLRFAEAAVARLAAEPRGRRSPSTADSAYPLADLVGRAHLLAGIARNWTGEFESGGRDLLLAYRAFARGTASEVELARVELAEATRRSFIDRAREGLILASRAEKTFLDFGMRDEKARVHAVKGLLLSRQGRNEEALTAYWKALPAFERLGLWNAYVTTLQNVGATLMHLGRLTEARREYARALRKVSRTDRPAVHAFIRRNLARTLFEAGEFAQAAPGFASAASIFEQQGATADALLALLYQIESFARAGAGVKARSLMAGFERRVGELGALDASTLKELSAALSGRNPDLASLVRLRDGVEETLKDRLERFAG